MKVIFGKVEHGSWRYCSSHIQVHLGIFLSTFAIACCAITWPKEKGGERVKGHLSCSWRQKGEQLCSAEVVLSLPPEEAANRAKKCPGHWLLQKAPEELRKAWQGHKFLSATDCAESCKWKQMFLMFMEKWQITISYSMADGLHRLHQVDI